jgi:hypothetical protein
MLDRATCAAGMALLEDEKQFIDLARSPLFACTERSIIAPEYINDCSTVAD